jgi:hypothetical protein
MSVCAALVERLPPLASGNRRCDGQGIACGSQHLSASVSWAPADLIDDDQAIAAADTDDG